MGCADYICVLDTGSNDGTYELLLERARSNGKIIVAQHVFDPWRFDEARNMSMNLIPQNADICVCTDLDEVFEEKGRTTWATELRKIFNRTKFDRLHYPFVWQVNTDGSDGVVFYGEKIHSNRSGYAWEHAVHEVLRLSGDVTEKHETTNDIRLLHFPDPEKSRGSYLPLLELDAAERPNDDRTAHYLGREYFFRGMYDRCIAELLRHLSLPSATWADERAASMRYLAKSYEHTNRHDVAETWYLRAIAEAPGLREGHVDYAAFLLKKQSYPDALYFAQRALRITKRTMSYINNADAWGSAPYDIMSVALWYMGQKSLALNNIDIALGHKPNDARLLSNKEMMLHGKD